MKYLIVVFLSGVLVYLMSFAKYNWDRDNRIAAVGAAIVGLAAFVLPIYLMFWGNFEV